MKEITLQTKERIAAAHAMQQQGRRQRFEMAADREVCSAMRVPDPISLPMIQYFQQPSRISARAAG
jgi:hypothetical protein